MPSRMTEMTQNSSDGIESNTLRGNLETILAQYRTARQQDPFGRAHELWSVFESIKQLLVSQQPVTGYTHIKVEWSMGQGNWASLPWIAFLDSRETTTTQAGVYCAFLFREDMSGVYLTYAQGVTQPKKEHGSAKAREMLRERASELRKQITRLGEAGFRLDDEVDLHTERTLGREYEASVIAHKFYGAGAVPDDTEILGDLDAILGIYDDYVAKKEGAVTTDVEDKEGGKGPAEDPDSRVDNIRAFVSARGFTFEPWQIAVYVTALRTKPFLILAGVSGTGKSKLPSLVAEAVGGEAELIPVRPDWTDSSDVLGYEDLQGDFRPGPLLRLARTASEQPKRHFLCIVDEMNLARVEYYFAEVLSRIEDRKGSPRTGYSSGPLLCTDLRHDHRDWARQGMPPNLAIVGTVNMDETTHGFSRKVLDRAFTIEFSEIDLAAWEAPSGPAESSVSPWPVENWYPRAIQLQELKALSASELEDIREVIRVLTRLNEFLVKAQLQVGYRTRDEMALFVLHAREIAGSFVTSKGDKVDPIDLAIHMKILPRIAGGSNAIRRVLLDLLGWAHGTGPLEDENAANTIRDLWDTGGRPTALQGSRFPRTAARLSLMWDRLWNEGFTSYWL
jgi:hypothetical protein